MAFGDRRGNLTGGAASTAATNNQITGSQSVSVGDVVVVVIAMQTDNTATTVDDNLGHTYTALNAGSDTGSATGRAYYARITTAGTLTTIEWDSNNSGNQDWAGLASVFEGPFKSSPLDKNPSNGTTDITSPFTCPATGTLTQADEIVVCWASSPFSTTYSATSPNLLAGNQAQGANIKATIGHQTVSATTSVAPEFTAASNPSNQVLGTMSFMKDANKSVTAAAGSYSVTGSTATTRRNLPIVAAAGSYAITGQTATLRRNLPIVAGASSYSVTGQAATLKHAWKFTAAAGSYAINGADAGLNKGQRITADAGSYSIGGAAASLIHAWKLTAAAGSYAVTGQAATLRRNLPLVAANGSYAVTGATAALLHQWKAAAAGGSYAISGADVALVKTGVLSIAAEGGNYAFSGIGANLLQQRELAADGGSYLISGSDADFEIASAAGGNDFGWLYSLMRRRQDLARS